jgi:hypothetical protein
MDTNDSRKLDASVAYLQMKIGTIQHFLGISFQIYGYLATHTLMKRIWNETEPHGMILKPAHDCMDT